VKIILFLLLVANLIASDDFSARLLYGQATEKALGDILIGDLGSHPENLSVLAIDGGYLLKKAVYDLSIDIYAKVGLSRFNEGSYADVYEITAYVKAFYNIDFLDNRIRIGLGEGGSYTSDIIRTELLEAQQEAGGKNSYFLNYLDLSADFDFGKLIKYKPLNETYIGIALKHRSGIFGLVNGVKKGGSNYNSVYLEKNF
jgi:outer membrane protein